MMLYLPPLDGAAGFLILFFLVYGIVALLGVTIVETVVLLRLKWGSFLFSFVTSFVMNLASTIVGFWMAQALNTEITVGIFLMLFVISVFLEGGIMLLFNQSRHEVEKVWRLAVISNVISYILLGLFSLYLF